MMPVSVEVLLAAPGLTAMVSLVEPTLAAVTVRVSVLASVRAVPDRFRLAMPLLAVELPEAMMTPAAFFSV